MEGKAAENDENKVGPAVVRDPKVFEQNPTLAAGVMEFIETLPSITTPNTSVNPLRRAKNLVRLLADSKSGLALLRDADANLTKILNKRLDGLAAERAETVAANVADIRTLVALRSKVTTTGQDTGVSARQTHTHAKDIDRDTRKIINGIKEGAGRTYYAHRVDQAVPAANKLDIRIEVAALLQIDGMAAEIEAAETCGWRIRRNPTSFDLRVP